MTLPMRSSLKPVMADQLAVDDDEERVIDGEVVSNQASLLLCGTEQLMSSGHSMPSGWSNSYGQQKTAAIHALDTFRPTHQSTLNLDQITFNACFHNIDIMLEALEHRGARRTAMLSCKYSEIMTIARLADQRRRLWSQYCDTWVLRCLDGVLDASRAARASRAALDSSDNVSAADPVSRVAIYQLNDRWAFEKATAADIPEVGVSDLKVVLPTLQGVTWPGRSPKSWTPHEFAVHTLLALSMYGLQTNITLMVLIKLGLSRHPLCTEAYEKSCAKTAAKVYDLTGMIPPLPRQYAELTK